MKTKIMNPVLWLALLAILIFFPKLFGLYYTNVFLTFMIFAVYAVAVNVLLGFTGLLSFGHAMFFGAGGYGTALALKHIDGIPLLPTIGLGFLAAMLLAMILAPLVSRVSGTAFAMIHLAFGQFFYVLALKLRNITGGEDGIGNFPIPDLNILGLFSVTIRREPENFYYLAMVLLCLSLWLMWFFTKTPFGQVQVGIRDNEKRIDYLGYKVPQTKAIIYVVSGAFSGLAGSIYGLFHNLVSADGSLGVMMSFSPIIASMVGGVGSFFGPIWGTAVLHVIEELTHQFTDRVELVMGAILILVVLFAPTGITGFVTAMKIKWQAYTASKAKMEKTS
jgi:branched-chain amino acid transport system permease protein